MLDGFSGKDYHIPQNVKKEGEKKMKKTFLTMLSIAGLALMTAIPAKACTSYYVGKDCTKDGSILYGRNEDYSARKDKVYKVIDSKKVGKNAVYKDETGATTFQAPIKVETTYRYTICRDCEADDDGYFGEFGTNSKGVSMSATTTARGTSYIASKYDDFVDAYETPAGKGGITEENLVDYILCQVSSAREGVELLASVMDTQGGGEGNGLFIADKNEVWYFEMLTGHNYCAIKMPDDKAAIIPNCFVIGDVDVNDTKNVIASPGLVKLAKDNNFFAEPLKKDGKNDINVRLSYIRNDEGNQTGYVADDADRIRGGQYLLTGKDNTDIYKDIYQDIFVDCKNITVEKVYEIAGYRYEDMNFGREITYCIGANRTAESHIFQLRSNMPDELATVQWVCMSNPDCSTYVPFYGALLTDTSEAYKMEAQKYNSKSAYWIFRSLGFLCEDDENRTLYSKGVKDFYKTYMTKMEALQSNVDKEMLEIYKNDRNNLEYYATNLGIAAGDQAMNFARILYDEVSEVSSRNDYKSWWDTDTYTFEKSSIDPASIIYDLSMVEAPKKESSVSKTVTVPAKVKKIRVKALKGKKMKVKIRKVSGAKGYEIAYSTSINFRKKVTKTVKTKLTTKTIKKLKKGKVYYVKVRAYKLNGTKKVYGKWSLISKIRAKK